MKKWIAFVLSIICILSLVACGKSNSYEIEEATKEAETWDLIPMVMVNGELYLDTGYESTAVERYDAFDGEITSEVDGSEKPTVNDQSNFGTGYGYQYGKTEGTIEIYMNDKWWIFATEEVRQEIQFPTEEAETISFHDKTFNKSDLSQETIEWLEWYNSLTEDEQLSISSIPADLYELCHFSMMKSAYVPTNIYYTPLPGMAFAAPILWATILYHQ